MAVVMHAWQELSVECCGEENGLDSKYLNALAVCTVHYGLAGLDIIGFEIAFS
jgi:hypothetical protein